MKVAFWIQAVICQAQVSILQRQVVIFHMQVEICQGKIATLWIGRKAVAEAVGP